MALAAFHRWYRWKVEPAQPGVKPAHRQPSQLTQPIQSCLSQLKCHLSTPQPTLLPSTGPIHLHQLWRWPHSSCVHEKVLPAANPLSNPHRRLSRATGPSTQPLDSSPRTRLRGIMCVWHCAAPIFIEEVTVFGTPFRYRGDPEWIGAPRAIFRAHTKAHGAVCSR